jgi:hypothetical protein
MSPPSPARHRSVRLWLATLAFAGLLAMHGLGTHGAHAAGPLPDLASVSASSHDIGPHVGHDMAGAGHGSAAASDAHDVPASYAGGLAGLCLALLAVGLVWLVAHTRPGRGWRLPVATLTATMAVPVPVTARAQAPPRRSELSVWRC